MKKRNKRTAQRGYTLIELMMALAIFSVGVTGITAMQSITASTNRFAKNLSVATALARSWQDNLAMDATVWGGASNRDISNTTWLKSVGTTNKWFRPSDNKDSNFGPGADAKGLYVKFGQTPDLVVFCTHIRLSRLIDETTLDRIGSGLLRSEVRVFWPKDITAWSGGDDYCTADSDDAIAIGKATDAFHFVYQASVVRQTPAF